jgi:hypothetical protein
MSAAIAEPEARATQDAEIRRSFFTNAPDGPQHAIRPYLGHTPFAAARLLLRRDSTGKTAVAIYIVLQPAQPNAAISNREIRGVAEFTVILRWPRSGPRRMSAEAPGPSPFEARFARASG